MHVYQQATYNLTYEERLLREAGQRKPGAAVSESLRFAGTNLQVLTASDKEIEAAALALLHAHSDLATIRK